MARLLVTGGAGFIGANFVHYWLANHPGDRLVVLDALTYAGNPANLTGLPAAADYRFVRGDVGDFELVAGLLAVENIDTIVHFAAESHVDRSIHGPDPFITTNIVGTHTLLKAAKGAWLEGPGEREHRFHHVSTDEVYGALGPDDPPFTESTPYAPNSPYAASKAASDHLVRAYHRTYGLRTTVTNCSNNYGPYQFPEKLIPLMIANILDGKPLPIYGDGMNVRDWLYVADHCRGIDLALNRGRPGGVYNIGGGEEMPNIRIVERLCRLLDGRFAQEPELAQRFPKAPAARGEPAESLITYVRDRPGHDFRYAIDERFIQRELGYAPQESFDSGLARTVAWYLDNEGWWRDVMNDRYRAWIDTNYQPAAPAGEG